MVRLIDLVIRYAHKSMDRKLLNPAIVAEGVRRLRPNARVLNICDMPVAAMRNHRAILGVESPQAGGGLLWAESLPAGLPRVLVDGEDKLPELRKHIANLVC